MTDYTTITIADEPELFLVHAYGDDNAMLSKHACATHDDQQTCYADNRRAPSLSDYDRDHGADEYNHS